MTTSQKSLSAPNYFYLPKIIVICPQIKGTLDCSKLEQFTKGGKKPWALAQKPGIDSYLTSLVKLTGPQARAVLANPTQKYCGENIRHRMRERFQPSLTSVEAHTKVPTIQGQMSLWETPSLTNVLVFSTSPWLTYPHRLLGLFIWPPPYHLPPWTAYEPTEGTHILTMWGPHLLVYTLGCFLEGIYHWTAGNLVPEDSGFPSLSSVMTSKGKSGHITLNSFKVTLRNFTNSDEPNCSSSKFNITNN